MASLTFTFLLLLILLVGSGDARTATAISADHKAVNADELALTPRQPSSSSGHEERSYLREWALRVSGGWPSALWLARRHGFLVLREIFPGVFLLRHRRISRRSTQPHRYFHHKLRSSPRVSWTMQQKVLKRKRRAIDVILNDPKWPKMWYLHDRSSLPKMRVKEAWQAGYMGQGVVVTILDDGIERNHPDLMANYDPSASLDVNGEDNDPSARYDQTNYNKHGTRCAGVVVATANNSKCSVGIAYKAKVGAVRMLDGEITDIVEATSLKHNPQHIDIYSVSWGPDDDGKTVDGPEPLAQLAFRAGARQGRGGLGSLYVWASGNGGLKRDNCNCDGYTNSIYTLSVNSVNEFGRIPWYSEPCSSTVAVTYSSGSQRTHRGVVTTDLHHRCTENHTGTSASAPMAAALVALALSANHKLSWRDMQHIVVRSARPSHLRAGDWAANGVGRLVSHSFGYGLMDAQAMTRLARNWSTVPAQCVCQIRAALRRPVYLGEHSQRKLPLTTDGCFRRSACYVRYLEHVQAKLSLTTSRRGELEIFLQSPMGTTSVLLSRRANDLKADGFSAWPFMTVHNWGELANGTWNLIIKCRRCTVSLNTWHLILYGTSTDPLSRPVRHIPEPALHHQTTFPTAVSSSAQHADALFHPVLCLVALCVLLLPRRVG